MRRAGGAWTSAIREIVVWGSPIELGAQDRARALRDRLLRTRLAARVRDVRSQSGYGSSSRSATTRPAMLFGYPSSLALIARHADGGRQNGRSGNQGRVRDRPRSSTTISVQAIARTFGCRVANGYGGRDAGFVAHECPSGGMHLTAEDVIVETVRPDGSRAAPGEPGEIVVTHLATKDFPFVRYRTGDIGVLDDRQCDCGRGLPLLARHPGQDDGLRRRRRRHPDARARPDLRAARECRASNPSRSSRRAST